MAHSGKADIVSKRSLGHSENLADNLWRIYPRSDLNCPRTPYQRSLVNQEKALGPEHPDVAQNLENYATLLRETGQANEEVEMEVRANAIRAKYE